jgi:predicted CopG family antitoxin
MVEKKYKHLAIDEENYAALCKLGGFHESFNDVIRRVLQSNREMRKELEEVEKEEKNREVLTA